MKILICSIVRNQYHNLLDWFNQIREIVINNTDIEFFLSVYENNSSDGTKELLKSLNFDFIKTKQIVTEDIDSYPFFKGSYEPYGEESKIRVKLLSECRNKCLSVNFLTDAQFVLFIEPDIKYDSNIFRKLYNFIIDYDYDVVSALSIMNGYHYDAWGTRVNQNDTWSNLSHLIMSGEKIDVYATFNCFLIYRAEPIIKLNCKFKHHSDVLNTHDCDTVLICEEFRKNNFNKICILPNVLVEHKY